MRATKSADRSMEPEVHDAAFRSDCRDVYSDLDLYCLHIFAEKGFRFFDTAVRMDENDAQDRLVPLEGSIHLFMHYNVNTVGLSYVSNVD